MPKLTVIADAATHEIPFSPGASVREILDAAGLRVRSGCRGNGACGLCLVQLEAGNVNNPSKNESLILTPEQLKQNTRLACQLLPENDLRIRILNTVSGGTSSATSKDGWDMNNFRYGYPQLFEGFIKSAQYLVRLKTQQDIWDHLGKFIMTYFPADWTAFVQRNATNEISIYQCTLPDAVDSLLILTDEARGLIADVLDSGFLASQVILTPAPSMTAFLPIVEEYRTERVMLIGHKNIDPLPKELLNIYLAIAGLAGSTSERLNNERELNRHRKHLEELVKERTAELDTANKELEAFSYSVSHDLRAPLRITKGMTDIMLKNYRDKLDDEGKELLKLIQENTERMDQLVQALLELSKAGRREMNIREIDMEKEAELIAGDLKAVLPERNIIVTVKRIPRAQGDITLIRQVFTNLLSNAIKFTKDRDIALIEVGGLSEGGENIYYVKDNGAGFDATYANRLFKVFQRLHGMKEFEGTGIGLSIVERIIRRYGGRVWAEGTPDHGATFYFTLPIVS